MYRTPCGIAYCPLPADHRFFVEGHVERDDLDRRAYYRQMAIVLRTWCHGHRQRHLRPELGRCRSTLATITPDLTPRAMVRAMHEQLDRREGERSTGIGAAVFGC